MKKLNLEKMEGIEGGSCFGMIAYGALGIALAFSTPFTLVSAAGALVAGAEMINQSQSCK